MNIKIGGFSQKTVYAIMLLGIAISALGTKNLSIVHAQEAVTDTPVLTETETASPIPTVSPTSTESPIPTISPTFTESPTTTIKTETLTSVDIIPATDTFIPTGTTAPLISITNEPSEIPADTTYPGITPTIQSSETSLPTNTIITTATITQTPTAVSTTMSNYNVKYISPNAEGISIDAKAAILETLNTWSEKAPDNNTFFLINLNFNNPNWALATLTSANLDSPLEANQDTQLNYDNLIALLLVKTSTGWQAAIDNDPKLPNLLALIPETEFSKSARDAIFPSQSHDLSAQQVYTNYKFPWPSGSAWYMTQGWHDGAYYGYPADYGLDFDIGGGPHTNSDILASAPGTVNLMCNTGRQAMVVITTDGTNERFGYLHLDSNTLTVNQGNHVNQGTKLGRMLDTDSGSYSDACGSSRGTHLHIYVPAKPFLMDGYTFSDSSLPSSSTPLYSSQSTSGSTTCYSLIVNPQGDGSAYSSPSTSTCGFLSFPAGTTVQLIATPYAGWHFSNWSGGPSGGATTSYTVNGNATVTAVFVQDGVTPSPTPMPPPPASGWNETFYSDNNLGSQCGGTRNETDVYIFRDSDTGWAPPSGCPDVGSAWSVRMERTDAYFQGGNYSFGMFYDDGARLYLDGNLIVDGWTAAQHYESHTITQGNHDLRLEYKNNAGHAIIQLWWEGPGALPGNDQTQDSNQWWVNYWGNQTEWQDSVGRENEGTGFINHDWGSGGPGFGIPSDHFSIKYERTVGFQCGTYAFHLKSDDGSKLSVDGTDVSQLDNWVTGVFDTTANVYLPAGNHVLKLDYFENGGSASVYLDWTQVANCIPSTPTNLQSSSTSPTSVTITWNDVSNEDGYNIYRWNGGTGTFVYLDSVGQNQTSYTETRTTCGWDQYYEVSAYNSYGESPLTGFTHVYTQACPSLPSTPSSPNPNDNSSVERGSDLNLSWSSSNADQCYIRFWGGQNIDINTGWSSCSNWDLGSQSPGAYQWQVQARNSAGTVAGPTWHVNVKPYPATNLTAPTISTTQVNLSWGASADAPNNIDGYNIYKNGTILASLNSSAITYQSTGLTCSTNYTFNVMANRQGVQSNAASISVTTSACPPANDLISGTQNISTFPYIYSHDINGSTTSASDPEPSCLDGHGFTNSVWFKFVPATTQLVNATTGSSNYTDYAAYDTVIGIYKGSPTSLTEVACNDDVQTGILRHSSAIFSANANTTYYIMVANWYITAVSSSTTLTFSLITPLDAPSLTTPFNGLISNNTSQNLEWSAVTNGDSYQLQVGDNSNFSTPTLDTIIFPNNLNYTMTALSDGIYYWHVRALDANNIPGSWSETRIFTIDTIAPPAPVLTSPNDGAILRGSQQSFSWSASTSATYYQFEYDDNADFSSPIFSSPNIYSTSYQTSFPNIGTYYWHVRASDAAGNWSDWSSLRTVTIKLPLPDQPTLSSPSNGYLTQVNAPILNWNASNNSSEYQIEISNFTNYSLVIQSSTTNPGVLTYSATPLADGLYYWHVRGLNTNDEPGPWSTNYSFTIDTTPPLSPELSSPANYTSVLSTPKFSWSASITAIKYQFEYDDNDDFSSPVYTSAELSTTSLIPPTMAVGTYSWHVRAKDVAGNWSDWSMPYTIIILPGIPAKPVQISPISGFRTNDTTPTLTWASVPDGNTYHVQISKSSKFTTLEQDSLLDPGILTVNTAPLSDGTHYWRVQAINVNSESSAWSSYRSFIIDTIPPSIPSLSKPVNNAIVQSTTPTFTVLSASGAKYYEYQVSLGDTFASPIIDVTRTTTSYSLTSAQALPFGTIYWRAQSIDAAGNASGWSIVQSFIINIMKSPTNNSYTTNTRPIFTWASASGALQYQIQVDTQPDFSSTTKPVDFTLNTTTSYTPPKALPYNLYYWRMRVRIGADWIDNWTQVWSFTVTY